MAISGGREEEEEEERSRRRPDSSEEEEYNVESVGEGIKSSRGSRFNLIQKQLRIERNRRRFSRENLINGIKCLVILPDSRCVLTSTYAYAFSSPISISKLFSNNLQTIFKRFRIFPSISLFLFLFLFLRPPHFRFHFNLINLFLEFFTFLNSYWFN